MAVKTLIHIVLITTCCCITDAWCELWKP